MDRHFGIAGHLEWVFEPWRVIFKEMKERKGSSSYHSVSAKEIKTLKNTVGSRFTAGLRSRIFGCKSNRRKTSTVYMV